MTHTPLKQQGFTLLEVLIALVLMSLLSIISWRALDLVERSSARLNASTDDTLALVRVLGQIESDISRYAGTDILPSLDAAPAVANRAKSSKAILPPGIVWADPMLTIVRSAYGGNWQKVSWFFDGDTLRRAAGSTANTPSLPTIESAEIMLNQVKNFKVRAWVPGQGWSSVDAGKAQQAATGLEIIILRNVLGVDETYRKVVLLP